MKLTDKTIADFEEEDRQEDWRERIRYALGSHTPVRSDKDPRTCLVCGNIVGLDHRDEEVDVVLKLFYQHLTTLATEIEKKFEDRPKEYNDGLDDAKTIVLGHIKELEGKHV